MKSVFVTKTFLPELDEYIEYLKEIWKSHQLTNHGPLVNQLEELLKSYLDAKYLFFVSNGTVALQLAIKALGIKKEIITTPLSYVATTSSIVWESCKPVFADVREDTLIPDVDQIEKLITEDTEAILLTHLYGNSCDL